VTTYRKHASSRPVERGFIGAIPENWTARRLRFVADPKNSNVDKKSYDGQRQVALCNYTDVYYNERLSSALEYMSATASDDEIEAFSLSRGDVIITKDSETADDIGIPAYVAEDLPGVVCGYHLCMLRPRGVLGEFLFRVIQAHATKAFFFVEVSGVTRYGLSQDTIRDVIVPVPPLEEQRAICQWINAETGRIDALIEKKTCFIKLLREKRQALIVRAVTQGLDPTVEMRLSGVEWIGLIPKHWVVPRLGQLATVENGSTPSRDNALYWSDGTVPWVGSGEVNQQHITEATELISELALSACSLRLLPRETVVVGMVGQGKTRGLAAILKIEATINQNLAAVCCGSRLLPMFLLYVFGAAYEWIREAGRGSNQAALNCEILGEFRLALPSLVEQQAIIDRVGAAVERIDELAAKTETSVALLLERRAAIITAAVTGQIDVRTERPAEALEPA
jgi:type I restriction enzyme S subunit